MFVRYLKVTKGELCYNPKEKTTKESIHVTFLEKSYIDDFKSQSRLLL